jgi:hypothetical protein
MVRRLRRARVVRYRYFATLSMGSMTFGFLVGRYLALDLSVDLPRDVLDPLVRRSLLERAGLLKRS